jgi:signal transduction histidine kinase
MKVHDKQALAALAMAVFALAASAQTRITLEQAGQRTAPDWTPTWEGKDVVVSGQASMRPLWVAGAQYLPVQDGTANGLLLQGTVQQFEKIEPGDWVEAQGVIAKRGGLPVLQAREIRLLSHGAPPVPRALRLVELATFRYLGVLVTTEGTVQQQKDNADGDLITIGEKGSSVEIFLPRTRRDSGPRLSGFHSGARIRVTGIAGQYCALPPYDSFFQILIPQPASVITLDKPWMIPPPFLLAALLLASALLAIWWMRERHMAVLRRQLHFLNALGEEVIGATSPAEVLRRLTLTLPELSNASGVGMYIQHRGTKTLESVHAAGSRAELIDLDAPDGAMAAGIADCFRNRELVAIPDTRRSPVFQLDDPATAPRSVLFVPMVAQSELMGVLVLYHAQHFHYFNHGEQAAMQHLANQVATALKLQEQHSIRDQLFRSEKLAAAGQLISDVANELRSPLESIAARASALQSRLLDGGRHELQSIADQARHASGIVARLVSFAKVEPSEAQPVDVNAILAGLLKFRIPECRAKGLEIRSQLAPKRAVVMGSRGQLEQVLLNLLVDAEKSATEVNEKTIQVSSSLLAKRVLIEISYPTRSSESQRSEAAENGHAGSEALGLGVCRGIIQSHGGEFRMVRTSLTQARFDVELPVVEARGSLAEFSGTSRQLTVLIVEPDTQVQRKLVQLLGHRGDRVVPVASAEEGADLAQRMRFDLAICAVRLPGLNWVEFFERVRHQVGGFVLLSDGFDSQQARAFQGGEGLVLKKPIDEAEVHRICRTVEERGALVARD